MNIKKPNIFIIIYISIFIMLPVIICLLMYTRMKTVLQDYMEYQVSENADLLGNMASKRLDVQTKDMERVAEYFRDERIDKNNMGDILENFLEDPNRISAGILKLDGTPVIGEALLASEYPSVQNAFRGNSTVRYREDEGFLFTVPIYNGTNVKYALYEFFDEESLFDAFENNCYYGQGKMVLVDSAQKKILPISDNVEVSDFLGEDMQDVYLELNRKMGLDTSVAVYFENNGDRSFLFLSELDQDNLYLLGKIPYNVVAGNISSIAFMVLLVYLLLIVLLAIGTVNIVSVNTKVRESDELLEAKYIAEEASKSRFLANMSHELRTPINVILGMDELILREETGEDTRKRALNIKSAAHILLGLINDVLDFSKIESCKMNITLTEYNLVDLLCDFTLLTENRARQKNLSFELDVQPELPIGLYGDDIHIRQVMINLLTNAVKYTNEGKVTLRLSKIPKDDETIIIHCEVIDTGIGIKQKDIDKLMISYTRIKEKRNRDVEGAGLGMSIIINLLNLMGSRLYIESVYGKGSKFYFDIEQKVVNPEQIGDIRKRMDDMVKDYEYKVSFTAPNARILMVDDNSMNRGLFASLLEKTKISVTTVPSGKKCLEIVQKEHFDMIFMDYLMPEMDGAQTLNRLQELDGNLCKDVPVIALTANAYNGAREMYMEMGFDDFLPKPIAAEKLEAMIRKMLPKEYVEEFSDEERKHSKLSGKKEKDVELPKLEGVNWEYALLHIENKRLLLRTFRKFYEGIEDEYQKISDLFKGIHEEEGLENYRIRVHGLKSVSAMVGILSISELAKLLEFAAKNKEIDKIYTVNPILLEELLKTKERLQSYMEKTGRKKSPVDKSQILGLFDMLRFSMDQMDIAGSDAVMEQLYKYDYESSMQEHINQLGKKIAALDYNGAFEEIEHMIMALEKK